MSLAIHNEATGFDCIFSWSLAIRILAVYVGFSRFRFAVWSRMHLDRIYQSLVKKEKSYVICEIEFRKFLAKASMNTRKEFS